MTCQAIVVLLLPAGRRSGAAATVDHPGIRGSPVRAPAWSGSVGSCLALSGASSAWAWSL